MLSQKYRLKGREIERLYKKSKPLRFDFFVARALENNTNHYRFAIIIPKSSLKKATDRNRLKRKIHASLYEIIKQIGERSSDISISVKFAPNEEKIKETLLNFLNKINI